MADILSSIDDAVLTGVNSGVSAWNWTTGKTKIDLVNNILSAGAVSENLAFVNLAYESPVILPFALGLSALTLFYTHSKHNEYSNIADLEEKAISNGLLHPVVEECKSKCAERGYRDSIYGTVITGVPVFHPDFSSDIGLSYSLFGAGEILQGLAHQTMRADYFPPRKNCVKRGMDNVSNMLKELKTLIPKPAFA